MVIMGEEQKIRASMALARAAMCKERLEHYFKLPLTK